MIVPYEDICRMAEDVAASGMFGERDPNKVRTIMLLAQAEGLHPAAGLTTYHIMHGRPAMKAEAMLARFLKSGGKVKWLENSGKRCAAIFSHENGGEVEVEWTIEKARRARLTTTMWSRFPEAMLKARVCSDGPRYVNPVACGIYTPEEIADFDDKPQPSPPQPPPEKPAKEVSSGEPAVDSPGARMDQAMAKAKDKPDLPGWAADIASHCADAGIPWQSDDGNSLQEVILRVTGMEVNGILQLGPEEGQRVLDHLKGARQAKDADAEKVEQDRQADLKELRKMMNERNLKAVDVVMAVSKRYKTKVTALGHLKGEQLVYATSFVMEHAPQDDGFDEAFPEPKD